MSLIPPAETTLVEFKTQWSNSIKKEIIAFANTLGGDLYIGVDDDGNVVGIDNPSAVQESVIAMARDNIYPTVMPLLGFKVLNDNNKKVLVVHVNQGPDRPYRAGPNDVNTIYVRVGNVCVPASFEQISRFVTESNPTPWEERAANIQNLTFEYFTEYCADHGVLIDPKRHIGAGLWSSTFDCYTNLGMLLSDQNPFEVKVSVYGDDKKGSLLKTETLSGSLPKVLEETDACIFRECLKRIDKPQAGGLQRLEQHDIAHDALREAVVNLAVHRDYTRTPPCTVHITPSQVSLFSVGGPHELTVEEILLMMTTNCRNPKLAAIFNRLRLMEGTGSGFTKIHDAYPNTPLNEILTIGETMFLINLPRVVVDRNLPTDIIERRIYEMLRTRHTASRQVIQDTLGIARSTLSQKLKQMTEAGFIKVTGASRSTVYQIAM